MWFSMIAVLIASLFYSFKFLSKNDLDLDVKAEEYARVGIVFGILGLLTGSRGEIYLGCIGGQTT